MNAGEGRGRTAWAISEGSCRRRRRQRCPLRAHFPRPGKGRGKCAPHLSSLRKPHRGFFNDWRRREAATRRPVRKRRYRIEKRQHSAIRESPRYHHRHRGAFRWSGRTCLRPGRERCAALPCFIALRNPSDGLTTTSSETSPTINEHCSARRSWAVKGCRTRRHLSHTALTTRTSGKKAWGTQGTWLIEGIT